jgi:transposase
MQIVEQTGLSYSAVRRALTRYGEGGEAALAATPRGRKKGTGAALTDAQQAEICSLMGRAPMYYGLNDALWSRDSVHQLIQKRLNVTITSRAVANYLSAWGLVLAERRSPELRCARVVQEWLRTNYSAVHREAAQASAEVYWLNAPVRLRGGTWKRGETSRSFISATTNRGKLLWRIYKGSFTADRQRQFISALVRQCKHGQLVLIRAQRNSYLTFVSERVTILPPN